jgi:hypothetical protein
MSNIDMSVTVSGQEPNETVHCADTDVPKGEGNVVLNWDIVTANWEITGLGNLPDNEFTGKSKKGGTGYKCTDKNDSVGNYAYTIEVTNKPTGRKLYHDPTIRNGGPD